MTISLESFAHQHWLGYVQPVGLVVSIPALLQAQAYVNRNIAPEHQRLLDCLTDDPNAPPAIVDLPRFTQEVLGWEPADLAAWSAENPEHLALEIPLPEYHEVLRPTHVVPVFVPPRAGDKGPVTNDQFLILVQQWPLGQDLDRVTAAVDGHWQATPQSRIERLLRETQVPTGLLFNGTELRLVYAPRGESSGYITFRVKEMAEVAGRPIFAALHMLLCSERLFSAAEKQRLPAILADSRKYQNVVSTQLAEQVLAALFELLRGFQAADAQWHGDLLREVLATDPNHVYGGLLNVLMRLVFILYAEDRNLLSSDPVYANYYSVTGLFERLRVDAGRYPDTMDQRYGAWAQLLTLFRLIYDGGQHDRFHVPPRRGYLFNPDRYPFLEGRQSAVVSGQLAVGTGKDVGKRGSAIPFVSDGVIFRVLSNLLMLDGERLSYRTLDVEQIGSVYQAVMGFALEVAEGPSIAIKPAKAHGAPATINLDTLLAQKPADRVKWLAAQSDQKLSGKAADELKNARTLEDLLAALEKKIARYVTPNVVPKGAMILQPSDERRRSGTHYTPRSLTEPIVRTTLRPVLESFNRDPAGSASHRDPAGSASPPEYTDSQSSPDALPVGSRLNDRGQPTPEEILGLKICDPAMGSAAFLVETCRQLGDELVRAWHVHDCVPKLPPDEDELLHARRLVAQRCLYGVDKNPMAVDLAKLSLWLVTLAKDHPFTFLDHSLRCGDSLVGLTRAQIAAFSWQDVSGQSSVVSRKKGRRHATDNGPRTTDNRPLFADPIAERMRTVTEYRRRILAARDDKPYEQLRQELDVADEALSLARLVGDCVVAAFFSASKDRDRLARLDELSKQLVQYLGPKGQIGDRQPLKQAVTELHGGPHSIQPFHWEIEFPEVFDRQMAVGSGQLAVGSGQLPGKSKSRDAKGTSDDKLPTAASGFDAIVGNPPFMGGSKISGNAGEAYLDWLLVSHPGSVGNADLVSHFFRRAFAILRSQGCAGLIATNTIAQGDTRASGLRWMCHHGAVIFGAVKRLSWPGAAAVVVSVIHFCKGETSVQCQINGKTVERINAFLFHTGVSDEPARLLANSAKAFSGQRVYGQGFIFDDGNSDDVSLSLSKANSLLQEAPENAMILHWYLDGQDILSSPTHHASRMVINFGERSEVDARRWPKLFKIVEDRVRPDRNRLKDTADGRRLKERWWMFARFRPELRAAIDGLGRTLVISRVGNAYGFAFVSPQQVLNEKIVVFPFEDDGAFCVLQSRVHEIWSRFLGTTLKDDLVYSPEVCFETFPFPMGVLEHSAARPRTTDDCPLTTDNPHLSALETIGRSYYEFRADLMIRNDEGLTKTYNRFHDPGEASADILKLRELHAAMDRAVLEAYGWHDLAQTATCEFLLDYADEEDDSAVVSGQSSVGKSTGHGQLTTDYGQLTSRRKKPWRYRWPDEFRDEVLARLLDLNKHRAEQERLAGQLSVDSGQLSEEKGKRAAGKAKPKKPSKPKGPALPGF